MLWIFQIIEALDSDCQLEETFEVFDDMLGRPKSCKDDSMVSYILNDDDSMVSYRLNDDNSMVSYILNNDDNMVSYTKEG